jgi:hypothetical protein
MKDKAEQQINELFVKDAISNNYTRKNIVKHYNDIIQEESINVQRTNKSLALKLAPMSYLSRVNFAVADKKKKNPNVAADKHPDVSNSLNFDESIHQDEPANDDMEFQEQQMKVIVEETPREKEKPSRINRKITKVKDLLKESQENALHMNKADLDKMFNLQMVSPDAAYQDTVSK